MTDEEAMTNAMTNMTSKSARYHIAKEATSHSFSGWVQPDMEKHFLRCCDCGLVHEMQFRIVPGKIVKGSPQGGQEMAIVFRARRAVGETNRQRKAMVRKTGK